MRRLIWIAASAFLLVGAGVAVARVTAAKSISAVSATFTATTASNVHTESCTGADGTYQATHGRWTGTASSSTGALNGPVTIDADALVNTTTGYGTVSGHLRIDGSDGSHTEAQFSATDTNGSIAGLAQGHGRRRRRDREQGGLQADPAAPDAAAEAGAGRGARHDHERQLDVDHGGGGHLHRPDLAAGGRLAAQGGRQGRADLHRLGRRRHAAADRRAQGTPLSPPPHEEKRRAPAGALRFSDPQQMRKSPFTGVGYL